MGLEKPASVAASPFKSAKWDELTEGRDFSKSDIPALALLCQWHEVVEQCMEEVSDERGVHVAYMNDNGDLKAFPQLGTMKQASAEIRALNKQLGINDTADAAERPAKTSRLAILEELINERRDARRA